MTCQYIINHYTKWHPSKGDLHTRGQTPIALEWRPWNDWPKHYVLRLLPTSTFFQPFLSIPSHQIQPPNKPTCLWIHFSPSYPPLPWEWFSEIDIFPFHTLPKTFPWLPPALSPKGGSLGSSDGWWGPYDPSPTSQVSTPTLPPFPFVVLLHHSTVLTIPISCLHASSPSDLQ